MIKYYVGVHDYFDSKLNQWFHTYHFHNNYDDVFRLNFTDNYDSFGCSPFMNNPEDDFESFRCGGIIELINIPENFTNSGKSSRDYFDACMNANNGDITET
jgi:hypothetical protein